MHCNVCNNTGMVERFQQEYNVGRYWAFCECEAGKREEIEQHLSHGHEPKMANHHDNDDAKTLKTLDEVFHALETEQAYGLRRWGFRQPDGSFKEAEHCVNDFVVYMQDYLTEAIHNSSRKAGNAEVLASLRKVVSLGITCFRMNGIEPCDLTKEIINGRDGKPA